MVGWFEIPVSDMDRATKFYETVFDVKIHVEQMGPILMGWFPFNTGTGAAGSLVYNQDFYTPSEKGTLVYFSSKDVSIELGRIESAGGKIFQPKTLITKDIGYMAVFIDSEGNRVALHSKN